MIEIAVKYLENVTGAKPWTGNADRVCRGCVIDSRQVETDSIFVAFPGERVDGNDYASQAIEAGAACVVLTREPSRELIRQADDRECAIFTADDATEFLLRLAQGYRARMRCTVVGITGSIGKTTTKDVLCALLATRYRVHATRGNYNSLIGMPLTILAAPRNTQIMVLEMGMDSLGQIERLSRCAQPTYSIITKIGTSHIGLLGSRENIARAKAEIVCGMAPSSVNFEGHHSKLILNGEDEFTPFITSATNIELDQNGSPVFDLMFANGAQFKTKLGITGKQAVPNALYAAAVASELGIPQFTIDEVFREAQITGHRQEVRLAANGARVIDDSYNASPESMAAGLDLLSTLPCRGARVAILGEMGELGDEAPRLHQLVGAYAASKKPGLLICVGDENARQMASAARLMGMDEDSIQVVTDCDKLIARYSHVLAPTDLVLVKGSRFVGLDRFVEEVC